MNWLRKVPHLIQHLGVPEKVTDHLTEQALRVYDSLHPNARPDKRFIILMTGRSGSSMLCDLLDSHPDIRCQSEVISTYVRDPIRFVNALATYHGEQGFAVYGCKAKYTHFITNGSDKSPHQHAQKLNDEGWKFILLTRKNTVRFALSSQIGYLRGNKWHQRSGEKTTLKKVTLDPDRVMEVIEESALLKKETIDAANGLSALELFYEEHLQTPEKQQQTCDRIFQLFDLPPHTAKTTFKKVSTDKLSDSVTNAEEIYKRIEQSRFADMLEDIQL